MKGSLYLSQQQKCQSAEQTWPGLCNRCWVRSTQTILVIRQAISASVRRSKLSMDKSQSITTRRWRQQMKALERTKNTATNFLMASGCMSVKRDSNALKFFSSHISSLILECKTAFTRALSIQSWSVNLTSVGTFSATSFSQVAARCLKRLMRACLRRSKRLQHLQWSLKYSRQQTESTHAGSVVLSCPKWKISNSCSSRKRTTTTKVKASCTRSVFELH